MFPSNLHHRTREESMREDKISGPAAAPGFSLTLARVAVAQICQSIGYKGAQRPALDALTDIATRYLKAVAKLSAESANSNGRTQSNIFDIIAAIEDLASVEGFEGSWRVRSRSLLRAAVVKDLMRLVKYKDEVPFAQPLPPRRSCYERGRAMKKRDDGRWYDEGRLKHVPRWLPAVVGREEVAVEVEERKGEVKWECLDLDGAERRGEVSVGGDEGKKLKRECNDDQVWVKRERVRFKMGIVGKI